MPAGRLVHALVVLVASPASVMLLVGASVLASAQGERAVHTARQGRMPVIATVLGVKVSKPIDGRRGLWLRLRWQAGGKTWTSKRYDRYARFWAAAVTSRQLQERYSAGRQLPLWVHPSEPGRIWWEGPPRASSWAWQARWAAGWLFVLGALLWWARTAVELARGNRGDGSDNTPFLVAGQTPPWPRPRKLSSWLLVATLVHAAGLLAAVVAAEDTRQEMVRGAVDCEVMDVRWRVDDSTYHPQVRVTLPGEALWSDWVDAGPSTRSHEQALRWLRQDFAIGKRLSCFAAGVDGGGSVELERPTRKVLLGYLWVGFCALCTLVLLLLRQARQLRARAVDLAIADRWHDPSIRAAIEAMGTRAPGGFSVRLLADGRLRMVSFTVGSEAMDGFVSIFFTLICAGIIAVPGTMLADATGWPDWLAALGMAAFLGLFAWFIVPSFTRRCAGAVTVELGPEQLVVQRSVLGFGRRVSVPRKAVQAVTQLQDGGFSSDSFPSWGLMVQADEQLTLLQREEPHRSRFLGPVIAAWAAVPYKHAGPFRAFRRKVVQA